MRDVKPTGRHTPLVDGLHVVALVGLALCQPLYDLLGRQPTFFVARRHERVDVILLAAALSLGLPLLLILLRRISDLCSARLGRMVQAACVTGLWTLVAMPLFTRALAPPGEQVLLWSLVTGVAAACLSTLWGPARLLLAVLAPATLLFPLSFVLHPDITRVTASADPDSRSTGVTQLPSGTTIVFVVFDALPLSSLLDDELLIDASRFPHFARLARDGTWFRNATTVHDHTTRAIPAMLTGRRPDGVPRLPIAADHPDNLFSWLGGACRLVVREQVTSIAPADAGAAFAGPPLSERLRGLSVDLPLVYAHIVLPDGWRRRLAPVSDAWEGFAPSLADERAPAPLPDETPRGDAPASDGEWLERRWRSITQSRRDEAWHDFVDSVDDAPTPTLYFHHALLPHRPWTLLPSGQHYFASPQMPGEWRGTWDDDAWLADQALQRHLLQVGGVDGLLGELLARLDALDMYDRSLIVVCADHGVSVRAGHPARATDESIADDIMRIPLLLKPPFASGATGALVNGQHAAGGQHPTDGQHPVDRNVETVDILPTIADALDAPLPWPVDGRSAFDTDVPARSTKTLFRRDGEPLDFDGALPAEWPGVKRIADRFGTGDGWTSSYRWGDDSAALFAARPDELPTAHGVRARLHAADRFAHVTPDGPRVPSLISGNITLSGADDDGPPAVLPERVAVAVGGAVQAVGATFARSARNASFELLVPPQAFAPGPNPIELIAVEASAAGAAPRLVRVPTLDYQLVPGGLACPDGRTLPLANESISGRLERALRLPEQESVRLVGWAADRDAQAAAHTIVVFAAETPVYVGPTGRPNRDAPSDGAGFAYKLPFDTLPQGFAGTVRVFAVGQHAAAELRYAPATAWLHP